MGANSLICLLYGHRPWSVLHDEYSYTADSITTTYSILKIVASFLVWTCFTVQNCNAHEASGTLFLRCLISARFEFAYVP